MGREQRYSREHVEREDRRETGILALVFIIALACMFLGIEAIVREEVEATILISLEHDVATSNRDIAASRSRR